ncbi:MAG: 2,3-bisphosphoglycerate-independent phosphoglycerate mutase [Sulfurospirillum sp.]|nr:2,3-bisphosphoglycerate-independent phosphoglycerate mutase [Sulfurospirillum sp.]
MSKKAVLIITDGIGCNESLEANAFVQAKKPTYDKLFATVPYALVKTSGLAVGLPQGQMGNSEVGHMCIGSGRVLYQNLVQISMAIQDGSIQTNPALLNLLTCKGDIHIIGLLSDGGVHSHIEHILALARIIKGKGKKVLVHALTDGRDVSPTSGINFIKDLLAICDEHIQLASIGGRFYAMDRDNRWDRVQKGYDAIVNAEPLCQENPLVYMQKMYDAGITDEFIEPISFGYSMHADDGVLFANFRNDRMRELSKAIGVEAFDAFVRKVIPARCITMSEYDSAYTFAIMFSSQTPENTLSEVIAKAGLSQLHVAETEKYAHVTFFFNGGIETPMKNESRVLIPSPKVKTYDLQPQMSAKEVCDAVLQGMQSGYDFIVVNFANGDMVGHTGVYEAGIKAVEAVDEQLGRIFAAAGEHYSIVLTSDHGNCEQMRNENGEILTNHTLFDVYCFVKSTGIQAVKTGGLNNIAPTILKLMELPIPSQMDAPLV